LALIPKVSSKLQAQPKAVKWPGAAQG